VPVWGLLNVVCISFGRVVECGRAKCAQKAEEPAKKAMEAQYQSIKMHVVVVSF
jgi:hypothetical protein